MALQTVTTPPASSHYISTGVYTSSHHPLHMKTGRFFLLHLGTNKVPSTPICRQYRERIPEKLASKPQTQAAFEPHIPPGTFGHTETSCPIDYTTQVSHKKNQVSQSHRNGTEEQHTMYHEVRPHSHASSTWKEMDKQPLLRLTRHKKQCTPLAMTTFQMWPQWLLETTTFPRQLGVV